METHIITTKGNLQEFIYDPSGSTEERNTTPVDSYDTLDVVSGGKGGSPGRKAPHPIKFYHASGGALTGTSTTFKSDGSLRYSSNGVYSFPPNPGPTDLDLSVESEALSRLFDKVRGVIDLSVSIAERGQVKRMFKDTAHTLEYVLRHPVKGLKQAYRDFRRYPPGSAKFVGSKWLEFQYGWRPLASDIYNSAIELAKSFESLMVVEARAGSSSHVTSSLPFGSSEILEDLTKSTRCIYKCRFTPGTSSTQLISNFTSLNPVSIAWELTPYSFVADWFYDVGGYLRNLESSLLLSANFVDGFRTDSFLATASYDYTATEIGGSLTTYNKQHGWGRFASKDRSVLSVCPTPKLPRFKADLGSSRLLSAAALLSQHLR